MSAALVKLYGDRREIEEAIHLALAREYPVGRVVMWMRGDHQCYGTVADHGYGDRIRVRNDLTKKLYWICLSDIVRAWVGASDRAATRPR